MLQFRFVRFPIIGSLLSLLFCLVASLAFGAHQKQDKSDVKTAPVKSVRFCVYGDTRDGHDAHRKVMAVMMKQSPEFVLQSGDLVHTGSNPSLWKIYDGITGEARKKMPFYIVRGNHDFGGKYFEDRIITEGVNGTKFWFSFDKGPCHVIGLSIDEQTPYNENSPQYKWLIKDLESTKETKPAHIFVFFHVAPFSIGSHGSDLDVRKVLHPVFVKYGVRAVFNGHDHNYYHTKRDGVTYIVSGGGGAPLYPCDEGKGVIPGDKFESVNHCVVCEANEDFVSMTALRADGTTLDRFTLRKP